MESKSIYKLNRNSFSILGTLRMPDDRNVSSLKINMSSDRKTQHSEFEHGNGKKYQVAKNSG